MKKVLPFLSITQALILIIGLFSFSYIIYSTTTVSAQASTTTEDYEGSIGPSLGDAGIIPAKTLVSYQSTSNTGASCCVKMANGAVCQDGGTTENPATCESGWLKDVSCSQVSQCQRGCCIDGNSGICSPGSPRGTCESGGGTWSNSPICNINTCQKNCCVIGQNSYYVTEKECEQLTKNSGTEKKYVQVDNENSCLLLIGLQKKGSCVYDQGETKLCKFGTKEECNKIKGSFSEGLLCSNPSLNTECTKEARTSCFEGSDEVLWVDSCGNKENIWEGNTETQKNSSYNNGLIKPKGESCSPSDPSCGNCDRFLGTSCGIGTNGKAMCKNLNCPNAPDSTGTKNRKNGETWCVYESRVGGGKNVPGSSQYLYGCINGEVIPQSCGDYKNGICNQETVHAQSGDFSQASCRPNAAVQCLQYNSIKNPASRDKKCNANPDCSLQRFNFGTGYKFSVCLPQYPRGFDLTTPQGPKQAKIQCKQADFTCTKIMTKKISGWECVAGCDCDSQEFTDKMTNWCTSLGDCGPGVNTVGKFTSNGYKVSKAPKISAQEKNLLLSLNKPRKTDTINADASYSAKILRDYYGISSDFDSGDGGLGAITKLGTGIGAVSLLVTAGLEILPVSLVGGTIPGFVSAGGTYLGGTATYTTTLGTTLGAVGTVAVGAGIGLAVGFIIAKVLGVQGQGAMIIAATTGIIGAVVGAAYAGLIGGAAATGSLIGALAVIPVFGWIAAVIIIAFVAIAGIGDTKETKVVYTCKAWQPPKGGADCSQCGKDPMKPCTPYKCSTLGSACQYINEGTAEAGCVNIAPNDNKAPTINQWNEGLTQGYTYQKVDDYNTKIRTSSGECIPEMTQINVGIKTDEYSQCVYSLQPTTSFDDAEEQFNEAESYTMTHNLTLMIPSAESVAYEILGNLQNPGSVDINLLQQKINEQYNNINYYARCQDRAGNSDIKEYVINTCVKPTNDVTPPAIVASDPMSGENIAYNTQNLSVNFYINEPASCKWSSTAEKSYGTMENNMTCKTSIAELTPFGWTCMTELNGINNADKEFYIKCSDKPWLIGTNKESERNNATQDFIYTIKATKTKLNITKIEPTNGTTIYGGTEPFSIRLSAETKGGVEDGSAECKYSFTNDGNYNDLYKTFSSSHEQLFDKATRGEKTVYLQCNDIAGNTAVGQTSFKLELDTKAPAIIRAFSSGEVLNIITDEESECAYSKNSCDFEFASDNATRMLGISKSHTTNKLGEDTVYYIRCKDKYNNPQTGCSMIARIF